MEQQEPSDWQPSFDIEDNFASLWPSLPSDVFEPLPQFTEIDSFAPNIDLSTSTLSPQGPDLGLYSLNNDRADSSEYPTEHVVNSWSSGSPGIQELLSPFVNTESSTSSFNSPIIGPGRASFSMDTQHELLSEQRPRTLPRRRSRYLLRRPAAESKSKPIIIPSGRRMSNTKCEQSVALQRWQNSPPEEEAASLSAIYNALENDPSNALPNVNAISYYDKFSPYRGPPSRTSTDSLKSDSSVWSGNSSHSAASQTKRRSQKVAARTKAKRKGKDMLAADRIFKCTFCCDTFKHKHDWARHERSLHLNMEEWACSPHGGTVMLPLTGRLHCAYCNALDPTTEHLEEHNHNACISGRSFRRKDHLVQHLRLVHHLETLPLIQGWKVELPPVKSRCGFCNATMSDWVERTDHLAAHFRAGKTMADWLGDHGFENAVTARITHGFPPYLIAHQSHTFVPFSATDPASLDQRQQLQTQMDFLAFQSPRVTGNSPSATGLASQEPSFVSSVNLNNLQTRKEVDAVALIDILARHLSKYAREQILAGILPTDEMFQREARQLLYHDADDEWNQTPADNQQWLEYLRTQTGLRKGSGEG